MSILQIAIGLMISGIIAAASIVGGESLIHAAKVNSIKTAILAVSQKSIEYAQINGSYSGLSCPGLVGANLEPANGCNGSEFTSVQSEGSLTVNQSGNAGYTISFSPTDQSLLQTDCSVPISGSLKPMLSSPPTCSTNKWAFTFGN